MKYIAEPVEVEAFKISHVGDRDETGGSMITLENGDTVYATIGMVARMWPSIGDYWVVQSDGYVYVNPKAVFERKYHPA